MKLLMILLMTIGIFILLFLNAGKFLVIDQPPSKADVIILLSGGDVGRFLKGVELYKQDYAPFLMISNSSEDNLYDSAIQMGVPKDKIIQEDQADSTTMNAFFTLQLMKEHGLTSALVVSSDYHMRRVKFNFDRFYRNSGIKLTYCAAASGYNPRFWFAKQQDIQTTFNEYVKLIGNALGFNGDEDKEPLSKINQILFKKR